MEMQSKHYLKEAKIENHHMFMFKLWIKLRGKRLRLASCSPGYTELLTRAVFIDVPLWFPGTGYRHRDRIIVVPLWSCNPSARS